MQDVLVAACGIWFPGQGWNLGPLPWECGVLATGSPGKSLLGLYSCVCRVSQHVLNEEGVVQSLPEKSGIHSELTWRLRNSGIVPAGSYSCQVNISMNKLFKLVVRGFGRYCCQVLSYFCVVFFRTPMIWLVPMLKLSQFCSFRCPVKKAHLLLTWCLAGGASELVCDLVSWESRALFFPYVSFF